MSAATIASLLAVAGWLLAVFAMLYSATCWAMLRTGWRKACAFCQRMRDENCG